MKDVTITLTVAEVDTVVAGLMELQGKIMLPVLQKIDAQVRPQIAEVQDAERV